MKCPSCNGKPDYNAMINGELVMFPCFCCKGSGFVSQEKHAKIVKGQAARKARIAAGKTVIQMAKILGESALWVSKFERGEC